MLEENLPNLLGFSRADLTNWFCARGEKSFRATQVYSWMHQHGVASFQEMTNVAQLLRDDLERSSCIAYPFVLQDNCAPDGTRKWLLDVGNANAIEMVFIPEEKRGTLCISSQAGCVLDCAFCSTGKQGFNRNLTSAEVIGQLWLANRLLRSAEQKRPITNVVMMGMGEPLANFDPVVTALQIMLDDHAYGLSRRRVTLSTAGLVPAIDRLRESCPVALAVSLHAPNDALRDELVPINRRYPLKVLLAACVRYLDKAPRDFITFEYVMLKGVNDGVMHAYELVRLLEEVPCKINLIPWNPYSGAIFEASSEVQIRRFGEILLEAGITTTRRRTRGEGIDAACGQLAGQVQDKTRRVLRHMPSS